MSFKAYIKIIRPFNLAIMALMLALVRYCIFLPVFNENGLEGLMPGWQFLLLVVATLLIAAGGYVINDVLDIELDKVNKPGRQIIGRQISDVTGNKLHFNLTITGVMTGLAFSYLSNNVFLGVLFIVIATSLFYYSFKYKYLPAIGNLVVAVLAAMVVMIYWLFEFYYLKAQPEVFIEASATFAQMNRFVFSFSIFAFLTTLTREIIKDAQDFDGDSRFGARTLPVIMGIEKIPFILIGLEIITLGLLAWFQLVIYHAGYKILATSLFVTDILFIYLIFKSITAKDKSSFARLSFLMKIIMLTGMLSLIGVWFRNL